MTSGIPAPDESARRRRTLWLLIIAVAFIGTVLRGPIVAVAPVIDAIRADLVLSAAQSGLLTSIPVLCFALLTPFAIWVIAKAGADAAISVCLVGVAIGTLIRSSDGVPTAIAGTIVMGAAITIGNVVVPVVIRRDFPPHRVSLATGIYTSALNVGSTITSLGTAPLAELFGWRSALGTWTLFPLLALACWIFAIGRRRALLFAPSAGAAPRGGAHVGGGAGAGVGAGAGAGAGVGADVGAEASAARPRIWRSLGVILLCASFSGQAFSYYGVTAWLPTLLVDENGFTVAEAGASSSLFQVAAIIGALGVPLVLAKLQPLRTIVILGVLWASVPIGLIFAPGAWALWCTLGGVAQGGGITVIFVMIVRLSVNDGHASRLSASVQGVGYAVAATAPTVIGFVHDLSGGWTVPLITVLIAVLTFGGAGVAAALRLPRSPQQLPPQ